MLVCFVPLVLIVNCRIIPLSLILRLLAQIAQYPNLTTDVNLYIAAHPSLTHSLFAPPPLHSFSLPFNPTLPVSLPLPLSFLPQSLALSLPPLHPFFSPASLLLALPYSLYPSIPLSFLPDFPSLYLSYLSPLPLSLIAISILFIAHSSPCCLLILYLY